MPSRIKIDIMKSNEKIKSFYAADSDITGRSADTACRPVGKFTCNSCYEKVSTPVAERIKEFFSGVYYESVSVSDLIKDETGMVSFFQYAAQDRKGENGAPLVFDLGLIDYKKAFDFQKKIVSVKIKHRNIPDIILILEHPAVFTLGKRGGRENLVVTEKFLKAKNIPVVQTERGGNITFHGPGQLVLYPVIDLERAKKGVADFVNDLEEIMIRTSADLGVKAERNKKNHGIWVKNAKIGSIGLSIKKGISFHGLAFNVNMDLEPFSWINPCGMSDISMTSIKRELLNKKESGIKDFSSDPVFLPDLRQVKKKLLNNFFTGSVPWRLKNNNKT